jgi:hypothetical protein
MSNTPKTPVTAVPTQAPEQEKSTEKKSFAKRVRTFTSKHKKPLIAGGALVTLVGIASVAGRKTDPLPDFNQPQPEQPLEDGIAEVTDTTVA